MFLLQLKDKDLKQKWANEEENKRLKPKIQSWLWIGFLDTFTEYRIQIVKISVLIIVWHNAALLLNAREYFSQSAQHRGSKKILHVSGKNG
jgi:hypothetical protein